MDDVEGSLREEIAALGERESVVLGEPAGEPGPPRGLLRRRTPPPPTRYVQYLRHDGTLFGECVGSCDHFGGTWPVTDEQHAALRELGWLAPGDDDPTETDPGVGNYWWTDPSGSDVATAARLGAGALEVLGVEPATLTYVRNRR
ncbi:TY-Chap domain-containing protein [Nocardioides caricicola]|uniref:TY-Chap N-terminal domain-containing protein n=1 Tax=Nocardioides caricicola TaxID=634770 RepID=A0ABW0MXA3_9ACTN